MVNLLTVIVLFVADVSEFVLNGMFCAMFLHCFYDETIRLTKKKTLVLTLLYIVITAFFAFLMIVIKDDHKEKNFMNYTIYMLVLIRCVIISHRRGVGMKKSVFGAAAALLLGLTVSMNTSLISSMAFYAMDKTGILSMKIDDISNMQFITNDTVKALCSTMIVLYMYFSYYKKRLEMHMRKIDVVYFLIYTVFLAVLWSLFAMTENEDISISVSNFMQRGLIVFFMFVLVIAVPIVMMRGRVNAHFKQLSDYQQTFLETELNASRQYKAAQEDTRAFRHDVQNNLSVVAMLMEQGKVAEAQQYLNDMRTEVNALSPKVVTGDEMLDSLVSSKMAKMEELGIKFRLDGVIDGGLDWKPMDTCKVFANLLDNAIEAASKTEEPFIELTFKKTDHHRLVRASNSCIGDVDCEKLMSGEGRVTSKEDKSLHGYGVGNIRKTVEKYGGMMRLTCKDKIFTMELILQK